MKFIDMFCGMGTARMGFEQAGHECVYSIEWDKHKRRIYDVIFGKEPEGRDIRDTRATELPKSDCWVAGFPCQDISVAGKQVGFDGNRSSLYFQVMRLLHETSEEDRPKYLLFENVKNFFSVNGGRDFLSALVAMDEVGYDAEWDLLNSKNFGVPQNRERVFIVGHLRGTSSREVFPITGSSGETLKELTSKVTQGDRVYNPSGIARTLCAEGGGKGAKTGLYIVGNTSNTNHGCGNVFDERGIGRTLMARDYKGAMQVMVQAVLTPDRSEKRQNGRRMKEPGEEMFTLTAQDKHGVMLRPVRTEYGKKIRKQYEAGEVKESRHNMTKLEPRNDDIANTLTSVQKDNLLLQQTRIRRLTPKECFRLQGFPDEYFNRAAAVNSDSQLYKQAGNSVTVNVIYEIARRLQDANRTNSIPTKA